MKSTNKETNKTIIWAFDPSRNPEDAKNIIQELKIWSAKLQCLVQPVTVCSEDVRTYPMQFVLGGSKGLEQLAQIISARYIKDAGADFLAPVTIFKSALTSRGLAVHLADYAADQAATMIFVQTKAKKGARYFRLGGFAEALATASKIPVLLMNKQTKPSRKISSMMFPTDFSRTANNSLELLRPLMKAFRSNLILFNQIENPVNFYYDFTFAQEVFNIDPDQLMKATEKSRNKLADAWVKSFRDDKISCKPIVKRQKANLAKEILKNASDQKVDLIAFSYYRGPLAQAVLGGTVRDVMISSTCPVLILHCLEKSAKAKKNLKRWEKSLRIEENENLLRM